MKLRMSALLIALLAAACSRDAGTGTEETAAAPAAPAKVLNVYNWSDYIAEDTIANFE